MLFDAREAREAVLYLDVRAPAQFHVVRLLVLRYENLVGEVLVEVRHEDLDRDEARGVHLYVKL